MVVVVVVVVVVSWSLGLLVSRSLVSRLLVSSLFHFFLIFAEYQK